MKKISLIILVTIWSCKEKPEIDNCACKFNMDLIINKDNKEFENLLKFYDQQTMQKCLDDYKINNPKDKVIPFENPYNYFNEKCPEYSIDIE